MNDGLSFPVFCSFSPVGIQPPTSIETPSIFQRLNTSQSHLRYLNSLPALTGPCISGRYSLFLIVTFVMFCLSLNVSRWSLILLCRSHFQITLSHIFISPKKTIQKPCQSRCSLCIDLMELIVEEERLLKRVVKLNTRH